MCSLVFGGLTIARAKTRFAIYKPASFHCLATEWLIDTLVMIARYDMRLVAWNCNMAMHRKFEALLQLKPDVAVISECADPERLRASGVLGEMEDEPVWIGANPHKGLAVFAFNGYTARLAGQFAPTLRHIAPVHIAGPTPCNLLAVWANPVGIRKRQSGPLQRALRRYKDFMSSAPAIVAGDLNNNAFWDRPGKRNNHLSTVSRLENLGLVSAYHTISGEQQGCESIPTLYWRDRTKDGPTYHIDYIFLPREWIEHVRQLSVGTYEDWCGAGLSDHVPIVVDVAEGVVPCKS